MDHPFPAEQYAILFEGQRRFPEKVALYKGKRPTILRLRESALKRPGQFQPSHIPLAYPPSTASLSALKPLRIRDLRLETHHRGHFIALRCIPQPDQWVGIMALAEDEQKDVVPLDLYN